MIRHCRRRERCVEDRLRVSLARVAAARRRQSDASRPRDAPRRKLYDSRFHIRGRIRTTDSALPDSAGTALLRIRIAAKLPRNAFASLQSQLPVCSARRGFVMVLRSVVVILAHTFGCWNSDEPALPEGNDDARYRQVRRRGSRRPNDPSAVSTPTATRSRASISSMVGSRSRRRSRTTTTRPTSTAASSTSTRSVSGCIGRPPGSIRCSRCRRIRRRNGRSRRSSPILTPSASSIAGRSGSSHSKAGDGEVAYVSGSFRGDSPQNCNGLTTCGTAFYGTINTCGAGGAAIQAARLTRQPGTNCGLYTGPTNAEVRVAQCCPATTGILGVPWFAEKACPTTSNTSTSCGTRPSRRVQRLSRVSGRRHRKRARSRWVPPSAAAAASVCTR